MGVMTSRTRSASDALQATNSPPKRARDESPSDTALLPTSKFAKVASDSPASNEASTSTRDVCSTLSDEVLLRILAHSPPHELLRLSTVCKRFSRLTSDSQLWRPHYYDRFVLPRANLIPGFRKAPETRRNHRLRFSENKSIRADGGSSRRGTEFGTKPKTEASQTATQVAVAVDWKQAYRLNHNWAKGRCAVEELPLHDTLQEAPDRKTFARFIDGLAITVDACWAIRVWDLRTRSLLAHTGFGPLESRDGKANQPTCLAVDGARLGIAMLDISVGFEDGSFGVWAVNLKERHLQLLRQHHEPDVGGLISIAYSYPYIMTATERNSVLLYTFEHPGSPKGNDRSTLPTPYTLNSLSSKNIRPAALTFRRIASLVVASFAWTFEDLDGWCIGVQDLDIRPSSNGNPDAITSRLASTLPIPSRRSWYQDAPLRQRLRRRNEYSEDSDEDDMHNSPIRLSYSHPYLLATLPDNTLVLHLCTSTARTLTISPGTRLHGHSSGICDAVITPGGKAVSVSSRGDEVRVWELEGGTSKSSIEVRPRSQEGNGNGDVLANLDERKDWVGFDDEMVIVLKEKTDGRKSLLVYDFT